MAREIDIASQHLAEALQYRPTQTTPTATQPNESYVARHMDDIDSCKRNDQCTLAVRIDTCCSCPEPYTTLRTIESDNLIEYTFEMSFGDLLPDECENVDCAPCEPLPAVVICSPENTCQLSQTPGQILSTCPDCFQQAAVAAYGQGNRDLALAYCSQTGSSEQTNCYLQIYQMSLKMNKLKDAEGICLDQMSADIGGCVPQIAKRLAQTEVDSAVGLCSQIRAADARYFGCMLDVALAVYTSYPERALLICSSLDPLEAELCIDELQNVYGP